MKDISWFDFDNKHYGVFVSNDGRIFTGIDGRQDQAYPLKIKIEKMILNMNKVISNKNMIFKIIILFSGLFLLLFYFQLFQQQQLLFQFDAYFFCWKNQKYEKNIEIDYFTEMNYQNSRNLTEMNQIVEEPANNHDSKNIQLYVKSISNIQQTYPHLYQIKHQSEHNESKQYKSDQSSCSIQIRHSSNIIPIVFNASQNSSTIVLVSNSNSKQPENNQINESLVHSSSGYLSGHPANTSSSKSLDLSQSTPLIQIHEPYPQYIDPSLHWVQQNQLQGSEKDFDPPLKKNPPIYSEVEQSHNINDEEQQIIID